MKSAKNSLLILLTLLLACNYNTKDEKAATIPSQKALNAIEKKLPFAVTASELCNDFSTNVPYAQQKYKDNVLELSGKVQIVKLHNENDCDYFLFDCGNDLKATSNKTIKCCLKPSSILKDSLHAGTTIKILVFLKETEPFTIVLEEL